MTDWIEETPGENNQSDRDEPGRQVDDLIEAGQNEREQIDLNQESGSIVPENSEAGGDSQQSLAVPAASPEEAIRTSAGRQARDGEAGGPLSRLTIGSALIAMDTLAERLEVAESEEAEQMPRREPEDVLIPMVEWDERFGLSRNKDARYVMLGMMADARSSARRGEKFLNRVSTSTAKMITFVLGPVSKNPLFRPISKYFETAVSRGETQVKHWKDLGIEEDFRSRRLAQSTINQAAEDTMDVVVDNQRVAIFIQEMVQAQSQGMINEGIEELRERVLSADIFLERPIRRLLRRPSRDSIPAPDFDPRLLLSERRRHIPLQENSLLGYYAGFASRLFALGLDVVILTVFLALSSWFVSTATQIFGAVDFYETLFNSTSIGNTFTVAWTMLSGFVIVGGYIMVFWILTGQTFGMMIMGLRVVATDGDRLTFWQAFRRLIGFFFSTFTFFIGFVWILFDNRRQDWPDKIGGTFIVYAWDARPDETFLSDYLARQY